jgi:LPXTG-site transpeptidase (sortase) family protein
MTRWLELVAWSAGILLLASYFALRAVSAHARDEGVEAMDRAREQAAAVAASESVPLNELSVAEPDTSTWATKRLAEYREALDQREIPDAVLRIPKLKLEVPVYEGTSETNHNRGAGWIPGTAAIESPGGNVGIAAHRDGFFRPLKDIAVGDTLFIDTVHATRQYRVTHLDIVDPSDVHVLAGTSGTTVTLVTCYPFYFVGSAPKRFIVRAELGGDALATREGVIPIVDQRNAQ